MTFNKQLKYSIPRHFHKPILKKLNQTYAFLDRTSKRMLCARQKICVCAYAFYFYLLQACSKLIKHLKETKQHKGLIQKDLMQIGSLSNTCSKLLYAMLQLWQQKYEAWLSILSISWSHLMVSCPVFGLFRYLWIMFDLYIKEYSIPLELNSFCIFSLV